MANSESPFESMMENLENPNNILTDQEKRNIRSMSGNVENSIRSSLVTLLMNQFSKVANYDNAVATTIKILSERAAVMEDSDLIAFLATLSKVSAAESKNIMDIFKKNDTDLKQFIREIQKLTRPEGKHNYIEYSDDDEYGSMQDGVPVDPLTKELSLEKKEKVLQLLNKLKKETGTPNEQND